MLEHTIESLPLGCSLSSSSRPTGLALLDVPVLVPLWQACPVTWLLAVNMRVQGFCCHGTELSHQVKASTVLSTVHTLSLLSSIQIVDAGKLEDDAALLTLIIFCCHEDGCCMWRCEDKIAGSYC